MKYAYYCYHRKDDNMLETCINSLRAVELKSECQIIVCTDGVPEDFEKCLSEKYGVFWVKVPKLKMKNRRATCKIEVLTTIAQTMKNDEDLILVSDVDVYYQSDPFKPFADYPDMDLGLTTRHYPHLFPINGGIFYIRVNQKTKNWLKWYIEQILIPTWRPYVQLRKNYHHEHYGLDWSVGQDFLIACWNCRYVLLDNIGLKITDVGPKYNYCPPVDLWKKKAFWAVREAIGKLDEVSIIHLKSDLKSMIYEPGLFPNATTHYPRGKTGWL